MQIDTEKWMRGKRATHLEIDDDSTRHVVYHSTRVVSWRMIDEKTAEVTLRTGGWQSATTKTRMNETAAEHKLDFRVYQEKKAWYVWFPRQVNNSAHPASARERMPFEEGMTFKVLIER